MANPQIENGYLKIANELSNHFCKLRLSGNEWNVVWAVIRKTYGFNKKRDQISLTQFAEITEMSRPTVVRCIKKLVRYNVLGSIKGDTSNTSTYWIIKDHQKWGASSRIDTSSNFATCPSKKTAQNLVAPTLHTKDNTKDIIKDKDASRVLKDLIEQVHKKGFNISRLINTFKKRQKERKVLYKVPAIVYIEVCKEYLRVGDHQDNFPYFMRILERKSEEYFAKKEITEHAKHKMAGMTQEVKELLKSI